MNRFLKCVFSLLISLSILICCASCDSSPSLVVTDSSTPNINEPVVEKKTEFYINETAELKKVQVSFVDMLKFEPSADLFFGPADGNIFIGFEFEIINNTDSPLAVSSMMSFTGYCDDYTCNYSITAIAAFEGKEQLDGEIAPGKKMRGIIAYEIPADWKKMEIHYSPNVFDDDHIVFIANND